MCFLQPGRNLQGRSRGEPEAQADRDLLIMLGTDLPAMRSSRPGSRSSMIDMVRAEMMVVGYEPWATDV